MIGINPECEGGDSMNEVDLTPAVLIGAAQRAWTRAVSPLHNL
jgi:hypothetical protein